MRDAILLLVTAVFSVFAPLTFAANGGGHGGAGPQTSFLTTDAVAATPADGAQLGGKVGYDFVNVENTYARGDGPESDIGGKAGSAITNE